MVDEAQLNPHPEPATPGKAVGDTQGLQQLETGIEHAPHSPDDTTHSPRRYAFLDSFKSQAATWAIGALIGMLGVFSGHVTEAIKTGLNKADSRTNQYEELAKEVSHHLFAAELVTEYIENDWTTKDALTDLVKEYNDTITTLRKNEFVYDAWIKRLWDDKRVNEFHGFMVSVKDFDKAIHSLNDELERVNILQSAKKIDRKRSAEALELMKPDLEKMQDAGRKLLVSLE